MTNKKIIKGVYCLTSPSGKRYVGVGCSENGIQERWNKYKRLNCDKQIKLYNALKKHGPENFKYEVILETDDADNAYRSEMYLIDVWNLQDNNFGYNIDAGGRGGKLNQKLSKETIEKRTNSRKDTCVIPWNKGLSNPYSDETLLKMSASRTPKLIGQKRSEEAKQKMRKPKPPRSKKHCENLSKSHLGQVAWNKGKKFPERSGNSSSNAVIRRVQNIQTGEIFEGCLKELSRKLGFFDSNIINRGKSNNYILLKKEKICLNLPFH